MKRTGCWQLLIGVESGVQKNLDTLKKGGTVEQIERAIHNCQKVGIHVFATALFGIPGETFEDGLQTIEYAIRLNAECTNQRPRVQRERQVGSALVGCAREDTHHIRPWFSQRSLQ